MKNFKLPIISIIAVMVLSTVNAQQINIIPKPVKLSLSVDGEVHELPARVMVYYFNAEAALLGEYLVGELSGLQGVKDVRVVQKKKLYDNRNLPGIHLYIDRRSGLPSEGYRL